MMYMYMKYMNPPWLPYKVSGRSGVLFVSFPIFSSSFPQNLSLIEMHFSVLVNSYHGRQCFCIGELCIPLLPSRCASGTCKPACVKRPRIILLQSMLGHSPSLGLLCFVCIELHVIHRDLKTHKSKQALCNR